MLHLLSSGAERGNGPVTASGAPFLEAWEALLGLNFGTQGGLSSPYS